MRVALISDLHGNRVALQAVFDDIARVGVDQTICLGDVATLGPEPEWTINAVRELGTPVILGNHDSFLLDPELIHTYSEVPVVVDSVDWCQERISADDLAFLKTFRTTAEIPLDAKSTLFLYHGTPRSNTEDLLATTPPDLVQEMLAGCRGTVMAGGHTHIQMLRQHRGMWLLNCGSVGAPFEEYVGGKPPKLLDQAEYATVDAQDGLVSVTLRRVPVDKAALAASVTGTDLPIARSLLAQYS